MFQALILRILRSPPIRVTTNASGTAHCEAIPDGEYVVSVEHDFLMVAMKEELKVGAAIEGTTVEVPLRVSGALTGHVTDASGAPVAGAYVTTVASSKFLSFDLFDSLPSPEFFSLGNTRLTMTDEGGNWAIGGLLPIDAGRVYVLKSDHPAAKGVPVTVHENERTAVPTIVLRDGGRLRVRVLDDEEHPVTRYELHVDAQDEFGFGDKVERDVNDEGGRVVLDHMRATGYDIEVAASGFRTSAPERCLVEELRESEVVMRLRRK